MSNRYAPNQPARYLELDCDSKGTILKERPLKKAPKEPCYDEVWVNDEGRTSLSSCNRIKRFYRHPLQKRIGVQSAAKAKK